MKLPKYLHNINLHKDFKPGKDLVCYSGPNWSEKEIKVAVSSLENGAWLAAGEQVAKFERAFGKHVEQKYNTMVNSGSSANLVMLAALKEYFKWPEYSEIIVSASSFPTTVAPIVQNNLLPTFVDVELATLNFDLKQVESAINMNTRAIFIAPVLGNTPDMDVLIYLRDKYGVELILDCCDSLGTLWRGKPIASYALMSSYSFYPAHHICTGEGGMISTNGPDLHKIVTSLVNWGRACYCKGANNLLQSGTCKNRFDTWLRGKSVVMDHRYVYDYMGYNLKPLDLQGAMGLEQLKKLDRMNLDREYIYHTLSAELNFKCGITIVLPMLLAKPAWFGVPVICESMEFKERAVKYFEDKKIQTRSYFSGNILRHPGFQHLGDAEKYSNADIVLERVFFIGASPTWSSEMIQYVIKCIREFE